MFNIQTLPMQEDNQVIKELYDWKYVLAIALEKKREIVYANIIAFLATLTSVPIPLLMPLLVDEVLLNKPATVVKTINTYTPDVWHGPILYISVILFFTLCLRLTTLILNVWQSRRFTIIAKNVIFRIRHSLLSHLEKITISEYETLGSGTVAAYLVTDLQTIDDFLGNAIGRLLVAVLTVIGIASILFWIHWPLALLILFLNPIVIYFTMVLGKHVKQLKKEENSAFAIFQQSLIETLDSIHQIRTSNRGRHYTMCIIEQAQAVKEQSTTFAWKSDAVKRFSFLIFMIGFDCFRAVAMLMVIFSGLSIGQMFAVFGYLWFMMNPVQEILGMQYAWYSAKAALERINALSELHKEPKYHQVRDPFANKHTVGLRIDKVHFSYGGYGLDVLDGINLDVAPGEKIAIVGTSGCGKSTLVQILIGLYTVRTGKIYYGGIPIANIGLNVIRENVVTVLQRPTLFNDSIRANLTMGRELSDTHLWQALDIAQLKSTVQETGLDTIVGRQGIRLSVGQIQRLAIARMVLSDPKVIILDEATSALDTETEYQLHTALGDFFKDKTMLIVAHRLSAIKQASHVYVLEGGTISEQGSHQELLLQNGFYSKLYGVKQST